MNREEIEARITVLAKASSNLTETDRPPVSKGQEPLNMEVEEDAVAKPRVVKL
jgi:hypothetical protein